MQIFNFIRITWLIIGLLAISNLFIANSGFFIVAGCSTAAILTAVIVGLWILQAKIVGPMKEVFKVLTVHGGTSNISLLDVKTRIQELVKIVEEAQAVSIHLRGKNFEKIPHESETGLLHELDLLRIQLLQLHQEEQERNWVSNGIEKFTDMLRLENHSNEKFYQNLISGIVKYMNANQGAIFLVQDNESHTDKHLSLQACYAYDRQRHLEKRIEIGSGIVGQAYLEKQITILRNLPDKYVSITSGLGQATASNILVVPMSVNENVECVLEIASFTAFEKFQIDFLEKIGQSIASVISSIRTNSNTLKLLQETQAITEQLRAQEEELRQNMEELTATQEEMSRKEKELSRLLLRSEKDQQELSSKLQEIQRLKDKNQEDAQKMLKFQEIYKHDIIEILNQIPAKIFLKDENGNMVLCNKMVADGYGLPIHKVIGTHDRDHFDHRQVAEWQSQEQEILASGRKTFLQEERNHDNLKYLQTTKMPFRIEHLNQTGIMGFQLDVTDSILASAQEKKLKDEISRLYKENEDSRLRSA